MVKGLPKKLVAAALGVLLWCSGLGLRAEILADYNFDDQLLQPGPDTFRIFQTNENRAAISYDLAQTGSASVHFTDPAYDQDFIEFQGYFAQQDSGVLALQFGFLIADADTEFNFALVGEDKYRLKNTGINFWIVYDGEWLRSYSNSIHLKLFQPQPFQWYTVKAQLDFDRKSYQLRVEDEHGQALYEQDDLLFAPGRHAQHSVREFSFVGDIHDRHPSDFFIDNFLLQTSNATEPLKLVAPGRKQLFVESWNKYQRDLHGELRCLPAIDLSDFSIELDELGEIFSLGQMDALVELTGKDTPLPGTIPAALHPRLVALVHWRRSCEYLVKKDYAAAAREIEQSLGTSPDAYIYQLTDTIIRASRSGFEDAVLRASWLVKYDLRTDIALAMIAFYSEAQGAPVDTTSTGLPDNVSQSLRALDDAQRQQLARGATRIAVEQLELYMPQDWQDYLAWYLANEQRYFRYVGAREYQQAYTFAVDMTEEFKHYALPPVLWEERSADTALLLEQPALAIAHYQNANADLPQGRIELKLSDAYFLLGDFDKERELRESVYRNFSD